MKNKNIILKSDSYTLLEIIGSGSQGIIWKAQRKSDGKELAIKTVLTVKTNNAREERLSTTQVNNSVERLQNEIHFLERLDHAEKQNIVPCLDSGVIQDENYGELPVWVMPIYKQTLEGKMPPYSQNRPAPKWHQCLKWIDQIATALEATHSLKINGSVFIHRDIKAANMMLTKTDDIRLIDFGIVRDTILDEDAGTHSYSAESGAPEQVLASRMDAGKGFYAIGSHSDMYALGSVIFRLFTGAQTEVQEQLNKRDTHNNHAKELGLGGKGLLGKIGGLSKHEYQALLNELQDRLVEDNIDTGATLINVAENDSNSDDQKTAKLVADFVCRLLYPDYTQRPTAMDTRKWLRTIDNTLPRMQEADNTKEFDGFETIPPDEHIALNLWQQAKYEEALGMELREQWLDELVQKCSSREQANQYIKMFARLAKQHPHHLALLQQRAKEIKSSFASEKSKSKSTNISVKLSPRTSASRHKSKINNQIEKTSTGRQLRFAAAVFIIAALLVAGITFTGVYESDNNLESLATQLESKNSIKLSNAWQELSKLVQNEPSNSAAQDVLDKFKEKTQQLFASGDKEKQKQAIPRLRLIAKNDPLAMQILAVAYHDGKGIRKNWAKSWEWYKKAGKQAETQKSDLEKKANNILHNKESSSSQRELAYQVVEVTAKSEPAGDPSQQWMAYRYQTGDGVAVDLKKANYWKAYYEGKKPLNIAIGNQQ